LFPLVQDEIEQRYSQSNANKRSNAANGSNAGVGQLDISLVGTLLALDSKVRASAEAHIVAADTLSIYALRMTFVSIWLYSPRDVPMIRHVGFGDVILLQCIGPVGQHIRWIHNLHVPYQT